MAKAKTKKQAPCGMHYATASGPIASICSAGFNWSAITAQRDMVSCPECRRLLRAKRVAKAAR